MTVLDNTPRDQYTASGGQVAFTYTFEIAAEGDIAVLQNGTLLNLGAGAGEYAVTGVGVDTGGVVTLVTGATAGDIITLYRDMALDRLTSYTNGGDFLAADVNNDFDRLWLALQQNTGVSDRALVAPNTDPTNINMTIPDKATRLGKYLTFNSTTGNPEVGSIAGAFTAAGMNVYNFTGDGTTVNFTLGMEPGGENNTQVYIDGVYQQKDGYNVSGAVVQFSVAPPNLSTIEVMVIEVLPVGATTASQVSFTQAGSTYGRNVQLKLQESVSVLDFGAIGDGVTDDTVAIQAALNSASTLDFGDSTYIIIGELTSTKVNQTLLSNGATLKLKASTTCTNIFNPSGAGLAIKGLLTIDGNRAGGGVCSSGIKIHAAITVYISDLTVKNTTGQGTNFRYLVKPVIRNIVTDNCGAGHLFRDFVDCDIRGVWNINLNATTSGQYQHCIDIFGCYGGSIDTIFILDPNGSTAAPSAWLSGMTMIDLKNITISNFQTSGFASSSLIPLATSILSAKNCTFSGWNIQDWAGNKRIEYSGCYGCTFDNITIKGDYTVQYQGAGAEVSNYGVFGYNDAEAVAGSEERHQAMNSSNNWSNIRITGVYRGFTGGSSYDNYHMMTILGNKSSGMELKYVNANTGYFGFAENKEIFSTKITNSNISCNGGTGFLIAGLSGQDCIGTQVRNNAIINNGQEDATVSGSRGLAGLFTNTTFITDNDCRDTQTFTNTDGCSFSPSTLATNTPFEITMLSNAERYQLGQRVTLPGSDSDGSDLTVKIIDMSAFDEVTVIPVDFVAGTMTAPLTTKTGTITAVGTAVTGSGTAFDTEIGGRAWVFYNSEYRQIVKVINATSLVLDQAFSSDPSGAAFNIVEVDVVGVPSQSRGIDFSASTNIKQIARDNRGDGNTDAAMLFYEDVNTAIVVTDFVSADATPSVIDGNIFRTSGTTAITNFDDGVIGQTIQILATDSITITNNANIVLNSSLNYGMNNGDSLTLTYFSTGIWTEVARSAN